MLAKHCTPVSILLYIGIAIVSSLFVIAYHNVRHPKDHTSRLETRSFEKGEDTKGEAAHKTSSVKNEILKFLPGTSANCLNLTSLGSSLSSFYHEERKKHEEKIATLKLRVNEGFSAQVKGQIEVYFQLASLPFVKTICETGFNAGHSTLVWLAAKKDSKVFSFDLGSHSYARPMAKHLQETFPGRLNITWGDSTQTLPAFHKANPNIKCDLIIVDGGHITRIANADLNNFKDMSNKENILVYDDYPSENIMSKWLEYPWESRKKNGEIQEIFRCLTKGRGFTIGRYVLH